VVDTAARASRLAASPCSLQREAARCRAVRAIAEPRMRASGFHMQLGRDKLLSADLAAS
jgi:hypothetical protein